VALLPDSPSLDAPGIWPQSLDELSRCAPEPWLAVRLPHALSPHAPELSSAPHLSNEPSLHAPESWSAPHSPYGRSLHVRELWPSVRSPHGGTISGRCRGACFFGRHGRSMIGRSSSLGGYYAASAVFAGFGSGGHGGRAMIPRGGQLGVAAGFLCMLNLRRERRRVLFAGIRFLLRSGAGCYSAFSTIEGDVGLVVDDHLAIDVNIGDLRCVHIHHGAVVEESAATPFAAEEAGAAVAEAIINATVEADLRAPVAFIPSENALVPAPEDRRLTTAGQQGDVSLFFPHGRRPDREITAPQPAELCCEVLSL